MARTDGRYGGLSFSADRPVVVAGWDGAAAGRLAAFVAGGAAALRLTANAGDATRGGRRLRGLRAGVPTGVPRIVEVTDPRQVPAVAAVAEVLQVGSAHMQDFALLREVAQAARPVLLARGSTATVDEWLGAAAYLTAGGNDQVILGECGIRTTDPTGRRILDVAGALRARERSGFPLVVEPTATAHTPGEVAALARAALAAGADGLVLDVAEHRREGAAGSPRLDPAAFACLMESLGLLPVSAYASLGDCRAAIDRLDDALMDLLLRRQEVAGRAGALKAQAGAATWQPAREREIRERLSKRAAAAGQPEVASVWRSILRLSRARQVATAPPIPARRDRARGMQSLDG
jgi:3-deoxy-7-phosphoheptulonate synthase